MTRDEMKAIVLSFPGVEEGVSYGWPSFKLNGKFFTRLRGEDDSLGPVDEVPDPQSGGCDQDEADVAVGGLVVSGG